MLDPKPAFVKKEGKGRPGALLVKTEAKAGNGWTPTAPAFVAGAAASAACTRQPTPFRRKPLVCFDVLVDTPRSRVAYPPACETASFPLSHSQLASADVFPVSHHVYDVSVVQGLATCKPLTMAETFDAMPSNMQCSMMLCEEWTRPAELAGPGGWGPVVGGGRERGGRTGRGGAGLRDDSSSSPLEEDSAYLWRGGGGGARSVGPLPWGPGRGVWLVTLSTDASLPGERHPPLTPRAPGAAVLAMLNPAPSPHSHEPPNPRPGKRDIAPHVDQMSACLFSP